MKRMLALLIVLATSSLAAASQTPQTPKPETSDEVVRISTQLVQTDIVVLDKDKKPIRDLKIDDFEIFDNGKKQDLKFLELVTTDAGRRSEGSRPGNIAAVEENQIKLVTSRNIKRVFAFVIDDMNLEYRYLPAIRELLLDFIDNKMENGDLVAVVRVSGGKGLLQQFTTDKQLLKRAVENIRPTISIWSSFQGNGSATGFLAGSNLELRSQVQNAETFSPTDDLNRYFRTMSALATANYVIASLGEIPGRKTLIMVGGEFPINTEGVTSQLNVVSDNAMRNGVVIDTIDSRGLGAMPGVIGVSEVTSRSALDLVDPSFGKGSGESVPSLNTKGHIGSATLTESTGGIYFINENDLRVGMQRILDRGSAYYVLAYTPNGKFDGKFHKLQIRVKRQGAQVLQHGGYFAALTRSIAPTTKEEKIAAAVRSPLANDDLDVSPNVTMSMRPDGDAQVDIDLVLDANKLRSIQTADGKHRLSFDIAAFVYDVAGTLRGAFSETINAGFQAEHYRQLLLHGIPYQKGTVLKPGYYQIRCVVRDNVSGALGSFSKYLEVPDLSKGHLAMSGLTLFSVDSKEGSKPESLTGRRELNTKQYLRYEAMIYNPQTGDAKGVVQSQLVISQQGRIVYKEAPQPLGDTSDIEVEKTGELSLAGVHPGQYTLTLIISEPVKNNQFVSLSHSIDFVVAN